MLGYLDEYNYRLMNDDHDFHCRALLDRGWVTGQVWIVMETKTGEGGVRINRRIKRSPYDASFIQGRRRRGLDGAHHDCFRSRKAEFIASAPNCTARQVSAHASEPSAAGGYCWRPLIM